MTPDDDSFFAMCGSEVWDDTDDITTEPVPTVPVDPLPSDPSLLELIVAEVKQWLFGVR